MKLCLPRNASEERKRILKAYGAEIVFTDPAEGSDGAIRVCREIYQADPDLYFYPDQYNNPANWQAHFDSTAPEIIEQTGGRITHFVAALGTSGTFMGVTRRLRRDLPAGEMLLGAAVQRIPRTGRAEAHAHRDRARASTMTRWRMATSGSKPKTPTPWCGAWRAKKACWWAFPPAATWWRR